MESWTKGVYAVIVIFVVGGLNRRGRYGWR
jgi:hypothetical protein